MHCKTVVSLSVVGWHFVGRHLFYSTAVGGVFLLQLGWQQLVAMGLHHLQQE